MDKTAKERMQRYREKKRNETVTELPQDVTLTVTKDDESVTPSVTPAIIIALADPIKRKKLRSIAQSLKEHNVLGEVRYGVEGPTFDVVAELLTAVS